MCLKGSNSGNISSNVDKLTNLDGPQTLETNHEPIVMPLIENQLGLYLTERYEICKIAY